MIACEPKYLHSPAVPDMTFWPFDVPAFVTKLERNGLEVNTSNHLNGMQGQVEDLLIRLQAQHWANAELHDKLNHLRIELRSYLFDRRVPISMRESAKKILEVAI